jgi:hypothetical protein
MKIRKTTNNKQTKKAKNHLIKAKRSEKCQSKNNKKMKMNSKKITKI